jgi:hypothetical protein
VVGCSSRIDCRLQPPACDAEPRGAASCRVFAVLAAAGCAESRRCSVLKTQASLAVTTHAAAMQSVIAKRSCQECHCMTPQHHMTPHHHARGALTCSGRSMALSSRRCASDALLLASRGVQVSLWPARQWAWTQSAARCAQ